MTDDEYKSISAKLKCLDKEISKLKIENGDIANQINVSVICILVGLAIAAAMFFLIWR